MYHTKSLLSKYNVIRSKHVENKWCKKLSKPMSTKENELREHEHRHYWTFSSLDIERDGF